MLQHSANRPGALTAPVRVLVVDDSAFMRHLITRELTSDASISVVGAASNGVDAVTMAQELQPDVVTLDVEMPKLDGLGALPRILEVSAARVIMLSSSEGVGQQNTLRALELGAVDFLLKPTRTGAANLESIRDTLLRSVHNAASAKVRRMQAAPAAIQQTKTAANRTFARNLVIIGSSTGGPQALTSVVPHLQPSMDAAVLVVQHMPAGFTASLASRLNDLSAMPVREAAAGDQLFNGEVLLAPGDRHLRIGASGDHYSIRLDQGPRVHGVRPSVDVTLLSIAETVPGRTVCAILTGMGRDGAAGAAVLREKGGWIIAQDEATCVIYGMPRSVVEAGQAHEVLPLTSIAQAITSRMGSPQSLPRRRF